MRKYFFLFLFILCFTLFPFAQEEDVLKIETSVSPKNLSRSHEGKIILKLIPALPVCIAEVKQGKHLAVKRRVSSALNLCLVLLARLVLCKGVCGEVVGGEHDAPSLFDELEFH